MSTGKGNVMAKTNRSLCLAPIPPGRFLKTDAPHSLKAFKTLIKRNRKKLDKKQNPNPGLTTRYCVLCYNSRAVSISSGAAPASNSRAFEDWKEIDRRHQQFL
jgi:hypothetical protein